MSTYPYIPEETNKMQFELEIKLYNCSYSSQATLKANQPRPLNLVEEQIKFCIQQTFHDQEIAKLHLDFQELQKFNLKRLSKRKEKNE